MQLGRFATKHPVGKDQVTNDHQQHEAHPNQNDLEVRRRGGSLVYGCLFRNNIGVKRVGHAHEAQDHDDSHVQKGHQRKLVL